MPARGSEPTQSLGQHYREEFGPRSARFGRVCRVQRRSSRVAPVRGGRQCVRFRTTGLRAVLAIRMSNPAPLRLRASRSTSPCATRDSWLEASPRERRVPGVCILEHDAWRRRGRDSTRTSASRRCARFLRRACQNGRRAMRVSRNSGLTGMLRTTPLRHGSRAAAVRERLRLAS